MELFLKVLRYDDDFVDYDLSASISASGGSIGRSADNDLVLPDKEGYISRIHAKIETHGNSFFLVDCSSNGTLLLELIPDSEQAYNEVLIHQDRRELFDGDTLVIGQFEIQIQYRETTSEANIVNHLTSSQAKVDITQAKDEAVEPVFNPPDFPNTPVVEENRDNYELESVDRSALQQHFPAPVVKQSVEPEAVKPEPVGREDVEPEVFNIDDFFAVDSTGNNQSTGEQEEDDIFANFQDPFTEEIQPEQVDPVITQTEEQHINSFNESSPDLKPADNINTPPITEPNPVDITEETAQPANIPDSSPLPIVQDKTMEHSGANTSTDAFFNGVGLDKTDLPEDVELDQLMLNVGKMFKMLIEVNMTLLKARADLKREFSSALTVVQKEENNPLKFCKSVNEALPYLLFENSPGFLTGQLAVGESVSDLHSHQMAMMAGIQAAIIETIKKFDPEIVEKGCEQGHFNINKASKCWDFYQESYNKLSRQAQADFFGSDFAEAYQRQVQALKKR